eukprot:g21639.t1
MLSLTTTAPFINTTSHGRIISCSGMMITSPGTSSDELTVSEAGQDRFRLKTRELVPGPLAVSQYTRPPPPQDAPRGYTASWPPIATSTTTNPPKHSKIPQMAA